MKTTAKMPERLERNSHYSSHSTINATYVRALEANYRLALKTLQIVYASDCDPYDTIGPVLRNLPEIADE